MRGEDIGAFQRLLSAQFKQWDINLVVVDDNVYGQDTRDAAKRVCKGLGILPSQAMRHGVTPALRIKIKHPDRRTEREKARFDSAATKAFRAALRERFKGPALTNVQVTPTAGSSHWGGSNDVMTDFVEPFMIGRGLSRGSGKRTPAENTAVGGSATSDHLTTRTQAAARDFPTFAGEDDARALAGALGNNSWQPNSTATFPLKVDNHNFRVQILWGAGIDHSDHVHVGIVRA